MFRARSLGLRILRFVTDLRRLAVIALVAALACWAAYGAQAVILRTYRTAFLAAQASRPVLINGAVVDLAHYVHPKLSFTGSQRVLLFVTSDTCPWCNAELPEWKAFLSQAPLQSTSVALVSFGGLKIPTAMEQVLSARGIHCQKALIVNGPGFTGQTGISATPTIIAMDGGLHVRFTSVRLTKALQHQIVGWASGGVMAPAWDSKPTLGGNNES
jgi:hypothetical protein